MASRPIFKMYFHIKYHRNFEFEGPFKLPWDGIRGRTTVKGVLVALKVTIIPIQSEYLFFMYLVLLH